MLRAELLVKLCINAQFINLAKYKRVKKQTHRYNKFEKKYRRMEKSMPHFMLGRTHVPHRKNTAGAPAVRMPAPETVVIPTSQHIGAPSIPCVNVGDSVSGGQVIATAAQGFSVPQHASIAGKVTYVDPTKIIIEK